MTPDQARDKVTKLRAHADSVKGTPEALLFYAKANELAAAHGLPLIDHHQTTAETPRPDRARPRGTQQSTPTNARRTTTMTSTATKTKPARPAGDTTMSKAFTPRTRAAFNRNSEPGTQIEGVIVAIEEEPDLDYRTRAPKLDANGNERMVPILIVQTDGTTKPYGQGLRKVWVRTGIADALIGACMDAGATRTVVGGKVRIRYEGLGEPPAPNFSAPKLYTASYQPPIDQEAC
ncbi:DUF2786 domain-containing protein [Nocardia spumae]|uniref:DUF2786 domain-containing protein n=1 Tax=Nocardia spumae TaxID=2887190 RepID=UPI001D14F024|nr:DUF2786 domain-containing protein [Nocardia spumae]